MNPEEKLCEIAARAGYEAMRAAAEGGGWLLGRPYLDWDVMDEEHRDYFRRAVTDAAHNHASSVFLSVARAVIQTVGPRFVSAAE